GALVLVGTAVDRAGGGSGSSKRALPAAAVTVAGIAAPPLFRIRAVGERELVVEGAAEVGAGIAALRRASRTFSTVRRVLASAGSGAAGAAPWTSDSTSTGVRGSVGVSSVGALRLSGGRIAVVWMLERVRRGTAIRRQPASRRPVRRR